MTIQPNRPTGTHAPDCVCRACRDVSDGYNVPRTGERFVAPAAIIVTSAVAGYALERYVTQAHNA